MEGIVNMAGLGAHFALTEKQAAKLLAADSDGKRDACVQAIEERAGRRYWAATDQAWALIHCCLSDGTLRYAGGTYPLNRCILGGKLLYESDDYLIAFVPAEEVRDVADALEAVTHEWFREKLFRIPPRDFRFEVFNEDTLDYAWTNFKDVVVFYRNAARANRAVIFTAEP